MKSYRPLFAYSRPFVCGLMTLLWSLKCFAGNIDPVLADTLLQAPPDQKISVIIFLSEQVDLEALETSLQQLVGPGEPIPRELRYQSILTALQSLAEQTQPAFLDRIEEYVRADVMSDVESFWIRNIIVAKVIPDVIYELAHWKEVGTIFLDGALAIDQPVDSESGESNPNAAEQGLRVINAHRLWDLGYTGEGTLVMNMDTGVRGNNLALSSRWRGTQPGVEPGWAWHDASGSTTFPYDCDSWLEHGTHTMGIMTGLYTASNETLGVAPSAMWIASNSLCGGTPHTSRSIAAFQWAANPDGNANTLDDVPDVINCSWFDSYVSSSECQANSGGYGPVIEAVEALGTAVVFSAGNQGPHLSTITAPKNRIRTAADIFAVGAINGHVQGYPIASFSSRGPSVCSGPDSLKFKPEVVAPGVSVRSAKGTNEYRVMSGTSMAAPHVAGAIALLRQVAPHLTGTEIKYILMSPVFVPMFMLLGYTPELTQAAYRIGDSTTNMITPMMSYFALIVAFAQKHKSDAGIGTIIAMMLPYTIVFLIGWALLLMGWMVLDLPVGPGAGLYLERP